MWGRGGESPQAASIDARHIEITQRTQSGALLVVEFHFLVAPCVRLRVCLRPAVDVLGKATEGCAVFRIRGEIVALVWIGLSIVERVVAALEVADELESPGHRAAKPHSAGRFAAHRARTPRCFGE
jgi:hypothetical protein